MSAKIIVIDGLDGSGKATQSALVTDRLSDMGFKVKKLTFPNYESDSSALVKMYLSGELGDDPGDVNAYAASSFYAVDRIASYYREWKQDYLENDFIVCDRYTTSNIIHQMAKLEGEQRDEYISWLFDYEYSRLKVPKPDYIFFLDLDPAVSQQLMLSRYKGDEDKKDIHEKNFNYLLSCRKSASYAVEKLGWKKIDCTDRDKMTIKNIDEITDILIGYIKDKFNL